MSAARVWPEAMSQIRTAPSQPPVTSQLPSGAIATALTQALCPVRVARACPVAASEIRTVWSSLALANQQPSGAIATAFT